MSFTLDERLARDTFVVGDWPLSRVLLMNDARWPWLILVARREGAIELTDLDPADRTRLIDEVARASGFLKTHAAADKINLGACASFIFMSLRARWAILLGLGRCGAKAKRRLTSTLLRERSSRRRGKISGCRRGAQAGGDTRVIVTGNGRLGSRARVLSTYVVKSEKDEISCFLQNHRL
jgi:hypothetical protein